MIGGFRYVFEAPADVGGRYSALTVFGLVPAALIGVDVERILHRARTMLKACCSSTPESDNPCLALGAALAELALAGRDKVTFIASPSLDALPVWIEQLIAESTGKEGKGIIPVVNEPLAAPELYGADRFFVHFSMERDEASRASLAALEATDHPIARIRLAEKADIGQEFLRWEVAVAAAGAALGIHPFNQPDVQLAKDLAQQAMEKGARGAESSSRQGVEEVTASDQKSLRRVISTWLNEVRPWDYVALEAYLCPASQLTASLQGIRVALRDRLRVPTTLGYGPRFLYSTGQLHKGGPNRALILQLVDDPVEGIWGLQEGYSLMVGGDPAVIERLEPIFQTLAPGPDKGWGRVGPSGAGHFVKMIHNGIEYRMMQAFAEGFALMQRKAEFRLDLHQIAEIWRHGSVVRSWLLDLIAKALSENQDLRGIQPFVEDSGEGRWTVFEAVELDVSAPVITLSLLHRLRSRDPDSFADKLLAAMRHQFGGHPLKRK